MRVRDLMTPDPQTIVPTETLAVARARMDDGGFRRLPVVNGDGQVIGIVTDRDLREHAGHLADTRVTGAMVEPAMTVGPDDDAEAVAERLVQQHIGGFPVVDATGSLVGIITEMDLLRCFLQALRQHPRVENKL